MSKSNGMVSDATLKHGFNRYYTPMAYVAAAAAAAPSPPPSRFLEGRTHRQSKNDNRYPFFGMSPQSARGIRKGTCNRRPLHHAIYVQVTQAAGGSNVYCLRFLFCPLSAFLFSGILIIFCPRVFFVCFLKMSFEFRKVLHMLPIAFLVGLV